jgi:hypothetical protein
MAWKEIKKKRYTSTDPIVTIGNNRFTFNAQLAKSAEIQNNGYVKISMDEENRQLRLDFIPNETENSYKVLGSLSKGFYIQCSEVYNQPWIKKREGNNAINRIKAVKEGKSFKVTFVPAFELSLKREDLKTIPNNCKGIYRYIQNGNIVYIGQGNIRKRIMEKTRDDWEYDTIEYSMISKAIKNGQLKEWESFWFTQFKNMNNDSLPRYNKISGKRI